MCPQGLEDATGLYVNWRADVQQLISQSWQQISPGAAGLSNLLVGQKLLSFRELTSGLEGLEEVT